MRLILALLLMLATVGAGVRPLTMGIASFKAAPTTLAITTSSLTSVATGSAAAQTLSITGGSGTGYVCNQVSAAPNTGLWNYITPACVVSGTPQMAELESVTYQVSDSAGNTSQKTFSLSSTATGSLAFVSPTGLTGTTGGAYYYQIIVRGGAPPYIFSSSNVAQPCAVTWTGWIECALGGSNQTFNVTVTDSAGATATQTETITVNATLAFGAVDSTDGIIHLPPANVGQIYHAKLYSYGGTGSGYVITATSGLPAWATLASGIISGTPTQSGAVQIALHLVDSGAHAANATALAQVGSITAVSRPAYNGGATFFVLNGQLYDPSGYPFRIRGVNQLHWDSSAATGIPNMRANTVRIWDGNCTAAHYTSLMTTYIAAKILPIVTVGYVPTNSTTCSGTLTNSSTNPSDLSAVVAWWVANESAFAPYMNQMLLNIANEWGPAGSTVWRDSYISAIASLRAAGYTSPIIIDSGGQGQDFADILTYAQAVQASDPRQSTLFAYHSYNSSNNFYAKIASIASSGSNTVVTLASGLPYHPFNPAYPSQTSNTYNAIDHYSISGVAGGGWTALNGVQPSTTNGGGASPNWTVTLTVNSSGFAGTYTAGTGTLVSASSSYPNYAYIAQQFAALRSSNVAVGMFEFGPGARTGNPLVLCCDSDATPDQIDQIVSAAEANGIPWAVWAADDNDLGAGATSWNAYFGETLTGPGVYTGAATDLTAPGLDIVQQPRYGFSALATSAPTFN